MKNRTVNFYSTVLSLSDGKKSSFKAPSFRRALIKAMDKIAMNGEGNSHVRCYVDRGDGTRKLIRTYDI